MPTDTHKNRGKRKHRYKCKNKCTHTHTCVRTHKCTHTQTHTHSLSPSVSVTHKNTCTHSDTDTHTDAHTERHRHRQTDLCHIPDAHTYEDLKLSILADGFRSLVNLLQQVAKETIASLGHLRDWSHAAVVQGIWKVLPQSIYQNMINKLFDFSLKTGTLHWHN